MPQDVDKTRTSITLRDERLGLINSRWLTAGTYTLNPDGSITITGGSAPSTGPFLLWIPDPTLTGARTLVRGQNVDIDTSIPTLAVVSALAGVLTPAQLPDATTDNWVPGVLTAVSRIKVDTAGNNAALSGLIAASGDSQFMVLTNIGAFDLTLLDANGGSAAANQFALNGDKVIPPGTSFMLVYDITLARWSGVGA